MSKLPTFKQFQEGKDLVITLPKSVKWEDYEKELEAAANGDLLNFKVPNLPKEAKIGNKCYIVHNGEIKGWMEICGLIKGGFDCTTTGKRWDGNFVQRTGEFNYLDEPIPMKGFQGYRYMK